MSLRLDAPPIGAAELQKLLSDVDPTALLVQPRLLRRVIKEDRDVGGGGLQVPHRKTYTLTSEALLAVADRQELGLDESRDLPERLILLACPEDWLASRSRDLALVRFWRLLYHARIDQALGRMFDDGALDDARVRQIIHRIGPVEVEEAFRVLRHENFLLPPGDLRVCFTEFVAVFFELRYFARPILTRYFPATDDPARVEEILREVIDGAALFRATRPAGAPDPVMRAADDDDVPADAPEEALPGPRGLPSAEKCKRFLKVAEKAAAQGNVVRSAIFRLQAADFATPELIDACRQGALADIERLVTRLQAALELHDREAEEWRAALPVLLGPASRGLWPPSARLLYDLQKVCVDYERDLYALDLVEWACSLGRKPIKREVPLQADVLLVKHLRSAAGRLSRARIGDDDRRRLGILLRSAIHHCEDRLREKIRPVLSETLREVGFTPANQAEEASLGKTVEELLDKITETGFLNMGHLRDAISRNQVKLPDLGPVELVLGDRLLKANRKLALTLDGVYHRGEIYLRWLQRFSSLLFGTVLGRLLTLYVILPFGGAFASLVFLIEMQHMGVALVNLFKEAPPEPPPAVASAEPPPIDPEQIEEWEWEWEWGWRSELIFEISEQESPPPPEPSVAEATPPVVKRKTTLPPKSAVLALGFFLLGVIHSRPFRRRVWAATRWLGRGLRVAFVEAPEAFFRLPAVRRFLQSGPVVFFRRRIVRPLLLGLVAMFVSLTMGVPGPYDDLAIGAATFLFAFILVSSRVGRLAEEAITDWLARNWYWLRVDALPGIVNLIIYFFKEAMDRIERVLYSVDEWFRFRPGDSRLGLIYKPILGLAWFFVTYLIRVIINLFVEPTVNPIKHFPAVTVGAKIIIPLIPAWTIAITNILSPVMGVALAGAIAGTVVLLVPGIFGFAVWEFKENWKLYRANRQQNLKPVMIGHHGETMLRFLKPGFHSGTLPKLFGKLRRAERRAEGRRIHKYHENLLHVAESIRHFVERELLLLLDRSNCWGGLRVLVGEVKLATNRVRLELRCPAFDETGLWLTFEERSGWLTAGMERPGWLDRLTLAQLSALRVAITGLYKRAGVALVKEQVKACLPEDSPWIVNGRGLILYPAGDYSREEVLPLTPSGATTDAPTSPERLVFSLTPVPWTEWVSAWETDREGQPPHLQILHEMRVLPALVDSVDSVAVAGRGEHAGPGGIVSAGFRRPLPGDPSPEVTPAKE